MIYTLDWHSYRLLPYERRLALREVQALTGGDPQSLDEGVTVSGGPRAQAKLERLTYFRQVRLNGTGVVVPLQGQLEATTSKTVPNSLLFADVDAAPKLRRQSTRYSVHGLHEYKGKFNPQIVRATANLLGLGLNRKAQLFDPFCGSGTSLVEAAHMGWDALGTDVNPLAILISNAKIQALKIPGNRLEDSCEGLATRLERHIAGVDCHEPFPDKTARFLSEKGRLRLPNESYLQSWFTPSVLIQLRLISTEISRIAEPRIRDVANVVLSDVLREVSLQDPADLRIRRRSNPCDNYPAIDPFINRLRQRVRNVMSAGRILGKVRGRQRAVLGDSRRALAGHGESFDAVITSPPYATALPYLDTQRLSLAFLGLLSPKELRALENDVIGHREISKSDREREEATIRQAESELPPAVVHLCMHAQRLAAKPGNGFRRRNVPALLVRYFRDMRQVFATTRNKVRPGGSFAMVVGPNRTTLDGETLIIDTPQLLGFVAETTGWRVIESLALDAYQRFALHHQNSITTERLVVLRRA
jgi:hypothetical protein